MKTRQSIRRPSFFRQGLLIVLPALILAGIGLLSLRQDKQLARLDAVEQAKKLAQSMTGLVLPDAFRIPLAGLESWQGASPDRYKPQEDPLWLLSQSGVTACLADRTGILVHPPPRKILPDPQPLPVEELSEVSRKNWESSQAMVHGGKDPAGAIRELQGLMDDDLPEAILALAAFQLGVLWQDSGNAANAAQFYETLLTLHPLARSDSGLLLRTLAAIRLMQMPSVIPPSSRRIRQLTALVAWDALFEPTLLSRQFLEGLPENEAWLSLWRCHERARSLYDSLENEGLIPVASEAPNVWKWSKLADTEDHLLMAIPVGNQTALLALPVKAVEDLIKRAVITASAPAFLGLQVYVAGRPFPAGSSAAEVLEDTALDAGADGAGARFRVRVFLSNADALYARQRTRTLWFGGLIGVSVASVLAGLFAARKAFGRQLELSEMKTNFVSSVSHELRAPIASVRLMAEEMEEVENPQKNREYKRFIVQECRRLSGLIENVLDFARHEQGRKEYEFESTDLEALLQETTRLMQAYAADRRITIQPVIRGEPVPAEADGRALQQVLVNLLDNAIKHSPPGSEIEAGVEYGSERIVLWVRDHGEGIPAEDHGRIFERFYRRGSELRRKTQGVGLGLAIVKYVTEAHGGTVAVESQLGQGSCFKVILPVQNHESGQQGVAPSGGGPHERRET